MLELIKMLYCNQRKTKINTQMCQALFPEIFFSQTSKKAKEFLVSAMDQTSLKRSSNGWHYKYLSIIKVDYRYYTKLDINLCTWNSVKLDRWENYSIAKRI